MSTNSNWRSLKSVKPENAKKVFEGVMFDVYQWDQTLYDGSTAVFEKIVRPDTVSILALTKDKKTILTKQEQPGSKPFTDVPGGRVDMGLTPLQTAQVELLEETGYSSENWQEWFVVEVTSKIDWKIFVYIAYDCVKSKEPAPEAGEKIEVFEVSFDEFVNLLKENRLRNHDIMNEIFRGYYRNNSLDWLKTLLKI